MIAGTDPVNYLFYISIGALGCILIVAVILGLLELYRTLKSKLK